jgi:NADH dehydrogenase [ubiquinone] 1 alpha subcomplex assembly factor 5
MGTFRSAAKLAQRQRAAAAAGAEEFDYLRDEAAKRLVERLQDITRTFPEALDLGSNSSNVLRALLAARDSSSSSSSSSAGSVLGSISTLHQLEPSERMLSRGSAELLQRASAAGLRVLPTLGALEGAALPFQDASLDLVLSSMALHWVNDVPGLLAEVRRVLKPDGAFLCTFLGGETLSELR